MRRTSAMLFYALDARDPMRGARARAWLEALLVSGEGVLSAQALTELANVALRRLDPPWSPSAVIAHVTDLVEAFEVVPVTAAVVLEAGRGVRDHRMSWFDAQMWAVARLHQVPYLLTEDLSAGSTIDGVAIVDPFTSEPLA